MTVPRNTSCVLLEDIAHSKKEVSMFVQIQMCAVSSRFVLILSSPSLLHVPLPAQDFRTQTEEEGAKGTLRVISHHVCWKRPATQIACNFGGCIWIDHPFWHSGVGLHEAADQRHRNWTSQRWGAWKACTLPPSPGMCAASLLQTLYGSAAARRRLVAHRWSTPPLQLPLPLGQWTSRPEPSFRVTTEDLHEEQALARTSASNM